MTREQVLQEARKAISQKPLSPMERWMVKSNLEYIADEGLTAVVDRLLANGYPRVAAAVEASEEMKEPQMLTVRELIEALQKCCNPDSVVCLSVEGFPYAMITGVVDETCPPEADGHIGNALLKLDPRSDISVALAD